jgi:O-methyltransferase
VGLAYHCDPLLWATRPCASTVAISSRLKPERGDVGLLTRLLRPVNRALLNPAVRFHPLFIGAQERLMPSPRETMIKTALEFAVSSDVPGDYLEFGVFEGNTFLAAYHFANRLEGYLERKKGGRSRLIKMEFYAFDSFEGLPSVEGVDAAGYKQFAQGKCSASLDDFRTNLTRNNVDESRIEIIPGWFADTLTHATAQRLRLERAAVVWVDCDLYESAVPVLRFITNYVQDGTVLIFDDWFCFRADPQRGEQRAFREWLKANPSISATPFRTFGWYGNSFILHKPT